MSIDLLLMEKDGKIQPADILLVHTPSDWQPSHWIGWAIRRLTKSYWNHAAVYLGDGLIIEAVVPLVATTDLIDYSYKDISVWRNKSIDKIDINKFKKDVKSYVGKPYDKNQIMSLLYCIIFNKKTTYSGSTHAFICSEVAGKPFYNQRMPVKQDRGYDKINPGDFATSPNFERIDTKKYEM